MAAFDAKQLARLQGMHHDILLYLGSAQHLESPRSNAASADLYLNYSDGDGVLNTWIGDLRIDDVQDPVLPLVEELISWTHLKKNMSECFETHEECRRKPKTSLPKGFRVIDVVQRRIVEFSDCSFVALSYVWGTDQRLSMLTGLHDTIEDMKKEGGLPASRMPQTIEDAMLLCSQLGHRYLWADRLCIIQDDAEDKKNQIEAMGAVYLSADLVLIAAHGDNMDYGIPGVSQPRNQVQCTECIQGLRITSLIREVEDDPLSVWDTRGWTYQEAVLSRRRLYFTNVRVFFECEQSVFHEDQFNLENIRDELISIRLTLPEDKSQFGSFVRHVKHFTSRRLTYRSDAYNALHGILKTLYDGENALVYGLPRQDFDHALLWYSDFGKQLLKRSKVQGVVLPSWSWSSHAGLTDQVQYRATNFYGPFVAWQCTDEASPRIPSETILDDNWQLYMAIACRERCLENISFTFSCETETFTDVLEKFKIRWRDYHAFHKEAWPFLLEASKTQHNANCNKFGVVAARCETASLGLAPKPSYSLNITNSQGERIGELCGDAAALREYVYSPSHDTSMNFDFIALSLSGVNIMPYSREELGMKNYYDVDGNALPKVPVVNVLMIGWEGGYAYRRALGWIYLIDWAKLEKEWKDVLLH
ncbi:Nn.00g091380.m01.CDS01 [Neocucurbitaria sp. VM-36]